MDDLKKWIYRQIEALESEYNNLPENDFNARYENIGKREALMSVIKHISRY